MGVDVGAPQSGKGVMILLAVAALIVVAIFTTGVGPVLLGAVLIAVAAYLLYVLVGRVNDKLRHGKPLYRGGTRRESGGDDSGR